MATTYAKLVGAILFVGLATASGAQSVNVANPAQYSMGEYLRDEQYLTKTPLRDRCLNEERSGRLSATCKSYKRDLNRLLRNQSPA